MIFKLHGKKRYSGKRMKDEGESLWLSFKSMYALTACLFEILVSHYFYTLLLKKGVDTIQARSNSDFDVKCATIQFYGNSHNSQSYHWIGLKVYVEAPDMFAYLGLKYHVIRSSERHPITGQQRLYRFCYLLPFDLWTSYLARILS